jgi:hypothetical protein
MNESRLLEVLAIIDEWWGDDEAHGGTTFTIEAIERAIRDALGDNAPTDD